MPCNCDGYSEPREMNENEKFVSLSRHHIVLEKETEILREIVKKYKKQLNRLNRELRIEHSLNLSISIYPTPPATREWRGVTYRDEEGKFPREISPHLDWLSEKDFKLAGKWKFENVCRVCGSPEIACTVTRGENKYMLCSAHHGTVVEKDERGC